MSDKKNAEKVLILWGVTLLFTLLVLLADRQPVGPDGTVVGFAHLNRALHQGLGGFHSFWYILSEDLGILAITAAAGFALWGVYQLIRRKSLAKVDRQILLLGGLYILTLVLYVLFDKLALNFRPVILEGETGPEASFPSSHSMLACVVFGSGLLMADHYLKGSPWQRRLKALCLALALLTVAARLLSGVHWFTDIVAGVLYSLSLLALFTAAARRFGNA